MTKNEMQHIFLGNVAVLIQWMQRHYQGFWVVGGDLWRDREVYRKVGKGSGVSLHFDRLAIDIPMIDKDKKALVTSSEFYRPAGEFWKSLHPMNRWGGDIPGDGNHFSMSPDGRI